MPGYFELYYGGGLAASESGSISIMAGSTLGGGTVVNYMNCVRTPPEILAEWEAFGLEGVASPEFVSDHMDVVMERIGANTEATKQNNTHQKLMAACDALGYEHRPIWRNAALRRRPGVASLARVDPDLGEVGEQQPRERLAGAELGGAGGRG